ncbi:MAG TPA: patatin-like phospholipase family protein, partial [Iamia sp.]
MEGQAPETVERPLALALSGGGHRATLFGLGALLYLVDAGQGPRLGSIASISGGSLTNGYIGLHCDLTTAAPEEVRVHARDLAHQVARRGTLWAAPLTWAFCALVLLLPIVAGILTWRHGAAWGWLIWAVTLLVDGWLAQQRSWVGRQAFERTLFRRRPLADVHTTVDHVVCATDLQTHELVYFSPRFVTSYRLGWGTPGSLPLGAAVQASAALPGAFSAVRFPVSRFGFSREHPIVRSLLLSDGGVYDNMGDQWAGGGSRGGADEGAPVPPPHTARQLIVANASAGAQVTPRLRVRWPVLGEGLTLLAVKDVLYDQTTAVRRRLLDLRFRVANSDDDRT